MASTSYILALLRIFDRTPGRTIGLGELLQRLEYEERMRTRGFLPNPGALEDALEELTHLGVLQGGNGAWTSVTGGRDGARRGPPPRRVNPNHRDGGGGRGGDGGGNAGDGDDREGAGGLAEVIAHPVLFTTGEAGLEAALDAALRG